MGLKKRLKPVVVVKLNVSDRIKWQKKEEVVLVRMLAKNVNAIKKKLANISGITTQSNKSYCLAVYLFVLLVSCLKVIDFQKKVPPMNQVKPLLNGKEI